ncbi:hypothetical protein [Marinomonas sp. IMCC 4694]|uniref:hypothetical protein n=1 Tax=Marinomonas sp. IMCC 4694 TaxID=2605432 RepID=UPI0011E70E92|nr:hypothetical protein [Marinomonas sp. IMCC 4694]TYL48230.1 hypothetical protein FXV75_09930 [Marinomonas sp. IMCC 4694]
MKQYSDYCYAKATWATLVKLTCLPLAFLSAATAAAPISAVIGFNNSQVTEHNHTLTLQPNPGTLLPLTEHFPPILNLQTSAESHWLNEIAKKVSVEHKQRALQYTGTLLRIEHSSRSFQLLTDDRTLTLPMDDFYLIPSASSTKSTLQKGDSYPVSYQTNQLFWRPQLSFIFEEDQVTLSQQALISNQSDTPIDIQNSLLHHSSNTTERLFKTERSLMAMSDASPKVRYQDNEISYSIGTPPLSVAPYSSSLIALPSHRSKIEKQTHQANVRTYNHNQSNIELNFTHTVLFSLQQDGLPGEYNTFWKRDNLLLPGDSVALKTVRKDARVSVSTGNSQDITGRFTLINASSQKQPSTQTWQVDIENHSSQTQQYSIEHQTNELIESFEGIGLTKVNANSITLEGKILANAKKTVTYQLVLKE